MTPRKIHQRTIAEGKAQLSCMLKSVMPSTMVMTARQRQKTPPMSITIDQRPYE